jgi:ribosomal protein S12 methylthiotransferase accessory factor
MHQGLRSRSGGKGTSDVQAKASALCEALERHSAQHQGNEPRRRARFRELGEAAIHPNRCMLISERQYAERDIWNARGSKFNRICEPFDEEAEIGWAPVWSMSRQVGRYLPAAYCYFQHPDPQEVRHVLACSNGNAAGNTLEEAILQGFLELVERDSVALWWYNRVQRPGVDLESFEEPYLGQLRSHLQSGERDLWVLDLTSDLEIPAFVSLSRSLKGPSEMIALGFGAHLDARIAVLRAVTEMNQCLLRLTHLRDKAATELQRDEDVREWFMTATLASQPYLGPDPAAPVRTAVDFPRLWSDDLREDVLFCQKTVEERGMEVLVLDQTRPDIGLPVVKVFVPGLRHFWARFAPGRLYDVPVKLGWLPLPLAEEELNPIRMFM